MVTAVSSLIQRSVTIGSNLYPKCAFFAITFTFSLLFDQRCGEPADRGCAPAFMIRACIWAMRRILGMWTKNHSPFYWKEFIHNSWWSVLFKQIKIEKLFEKTLHISITYLSALRFRLSEESKRRHLNYICMNLLQVTPDEMKKKISSNLQGRLFNTCYKT